MLAEYFEKNPDHLPTSNGRRFFCIASYDQRAIIKFSIQQNLYDLSTIFSPLRFFLDRNGGKEPEHAPLVERALLSSILNTYVQKKNWRGQYGMW